MRAEIRKYECTMRIWLAGKDNTPEGVFESNASGMIVCEE